LSNFAGLIQNENVKIYRKNANRIMLGILLVLIIATGLIIKFSGDPSADNKHWKADLTQQNKEYENQITQVPQSATYLKKEIALNNYRLSHDLPPAQGENIWGFVNDMSNLLQVISIFTIIVVATSIASEFNWGTIKLLLIRPVSRTSILLSKYISTLIFAVFSLIGLFIVSLLVGGLLFGFGDVSQPYLQYSGGHVHETSWVLYVFKQYGYGCITLIMMVTLAAAISAIFRSSAVSIGLSIFLLMAGSAIVSFLSGYAWVKYVLFANLDLSQYLGGTPLRQDMSLGFSVGVLIVYYLIFILLGWLFFTKRDVAA
jgi:ABC-2 type transport system permease protein